MQRVRAVIVPLRIAALLLAAVIVGLICVPIILAPQPVSAGGGRVSPDGRYLAALYAVKVPHYFRKTVCYYELKCYGRATEEERLRTNAQFGSVPLHSVKIPIADEERLITVRGEPPFPILWDRDSSRFQTQIGVVGIQIKVIAHAQ